MKHTTHLADMSRRSFLTSLAAGAAVCGCGGGGGSDDSAEAPAGPRGSLRTLGAGCYSPAMAGYDTGSIGCGIGTTFGDPWFDQRFIQELNLQAAFFAGFTPAVYVLDECSVVQANALSDPRGFILFGRWLALKTIVETRSELPIAGILAHEWAHQMQFRFSWMQTSEPTVRRTELEADMWSGLYMGMAKLWAGPQLSAYFQALFNLGDFSFNDRNHHGTPNQRLAAGATGLNVAQQVLTSRQRLSVDQFHQIFLTEISRITATIQSSPPGHGESGTVARLPYPVDQVASTLDREWLRGIVDGERSVTELDRMPDVSMDDRQNLFPY